jgi:transketolase
LTEKKPTALALSRQNLAPIPSSSKDAGRGGYILSPEDGESPDAILVASGSEVGIALEAKALLKEKGVDARVVSMPSLDVFFEQPAAYRDDVLPPSVAKRVVVEAGSRYSWGHIAGLTGACITMDEFGASGPAGKLFEKYGFTAENIAHTCLEL